MFSMLGSKPQILHFCLPLHYLRFLDFGLLCRMEKKHQFAMLASIVHIVYGDWASLVNALIEMDVVRPGTNLRQVTMVRVGPEICLHKPFNFVCFSFDSLGVLDLYQFWLY